MTRMGFDQFYIQLVEECPCDNRDQLMKKEGQCIRDIATLNNNIAGEVKANINTITRPR